MRTRRRWLLATNLLLAASIGVAVWAVPANGNQPAARARGQYSMVAGELRSGGEASAIYITDSINEELIALRWNDSRSQLDGLDYRSLQMDAARGGER
ncbi:MAG: hypothetical protein IT431_04725 [Phycisphaerales bacterium]|nr:hypothetical protein [Phycisphaerales bacterium]